MSKKELVEDLPEVAIPELTAEDVTPPAKAEEPSHIPQENRRSESVAAPDLRHGVAGRVLTVAQMGQIAHETGRALAAQPKVKVYLPRVEGAKAEYQVETVQINGYIIAVNRGLFVDVPLTVAKILREAGYPVDIPEVA